MVKAEEMVNTKDRQLMVKMVSLAKGRTHLTSWAKISFQAFKVSRFSYFEFAFQMLLFLFHLNNSV